ncbi:hypothetical protein [uncultured Subdoligranulum sp.]|uniref:hypothetical protein n=1 Tax=uncultured Subdoligranulum sp. TaxID=512298 RepID=UPI002627B4BB|nr:hypothetical protein [uncultured Subdoligranulum sp.]
MNKPRLRQFLALFLVLCMLCSTTLPIYAESSTREVVPVETAVSVATPESSASESSTEKSSDPIDTSLLTSATAETSLSEAAQAFVDAVAALDREEILSAINAWGLASQAWQADKSNAELTAALDAATEASDVVAAPVYAAEDLYLALSDEEREIEAVKTAYSSLTALIISMQLAMQNPTAPGESSSEPELDEISTVLYGDLPDAPTGSYIGEYGLPVATGDTKISISAWKNDLLDASSRGRLDAVALNEENAVMSVAKQDGTDYAIVPIAVQVEYPANGATSTITLPDTVELLSYTSTSDNLVTASDKERSQILNATYNDSSASASGFYVKATEDFSAAFTYSAPDGTTISKTLNVTIDDNAEVQSLPTSSGNSVSTYANTPQPPFTTGKITKIEYVVSTWLVWFNGVEAYCCDNGLSGQPNGCPVYTFQYVSTLDPGQYTPGNHYANQISIWGGLNQLSMGFLSKSHDVNGFAGSSFAAGASTTYSTTSNDVLKTAYEYYNDTQLWIVENYPNSVAAQIYMKSAAALENNGLDATPYLGNGGYYTFAYFPPAGYNWQRIVVIGPEIDEDDDTSELPETPEMQYYSADWTAPPQSASGSFDLTYTVHIDKSANITHEKLDDAIFKLTPNPSSGTISGGTWTIGDPQIVTTVDGAASATWTLHYEVTKTSTTTLSGKEGPYNTQEEANAAAEAAKNNAIAQLQNEAQAMVDAAIAEAKAQLAKITIDYEETTVPHGFDPTDSSSGSVSVPSNGSATAVVANQPWQAHVTWEKRDALTGGRITEDAEYAIYEWNVNKNGYEISSNYRVTRLENGLYTVTVTNPVYTDWTEGYVYYTQDNLGKFRIEEVTAPAGYTDAALQGTDWVEHWSQEFEITDSDQTYSYTGDDADYNRPQGNKVIIKKIEAHTGEIIVDDAVFTLYQWNQERGLYEKSKDYAFVRDAEGLYTITCLHDDWSQYEEGNLYYEDTLCDIREDTVNSDGTTTEHPQYYTDYEPVDFSIDERAVTNDGQFVVVESQSPYGYYGDWTGSRETPNFEVEDAGKRAYYIRLTGDGSTITLTDSEYNAHVLTENKGGTLIDLGNEIVSLDIFRQAQEKYAEGNLFRNNPWYSTVVWEKRDALTGGLVDASAEYEIQEWDPKAGEYKKSTHYQVVRRDDGKYTVNLIGDAFFPGWEGKQGVLYYHQANEGKYRIVELKAPASYNLKAWEHDNWVIGWSEEIVVHPDHPSYEFLGETAAYNMPYKTKVLIKKVDDDSGEFILPETTWTLYEWNERNNQYEVSTNYKIVRREDGYYTVTTLHSDWTHYEEGYLYYEDTQTDYSDSGRWFSNQGKFLIVESKAPAGYYGDYWRNDEPGTHSTDNGSDLGKRGYAFTLTEDNGTLWLTNADYNAKILYDLDDQKGDATLVLADGRPTSVIINNKQQPSYKRDETGFGNTAKYGYVVFDRSQYNKKWAQTGDDETYTTSYETTTSKLNDQIAAPEDTLWKNGKLFQLEDFSSDLISGPVDRQVTLENVKSLDDVPPTMEYSLTDGTTVTLHLVSADWIEEPRSNYTGFVDLGYSPTQPKANETETITADDGYTFTGHLVGIEQTGDYGWVDMEVPATYYGWPDVKGIFLGNLVLPHNDNKPVYEGYETDILIYLGFNNKDYKITNAEWTGSWEAMPGADMMSRSATFTISCYTTGWIAQYEEAEDAERTGTVSASYSFVDSSSVEDGMYHWLVTAHYKPASIWTVLQTAAAVLGIGLLIAALVLILFILSRKRKAKKRTTEKA